MYDIELDGVGYMLATGRGNTGNYRKLAAGGRGLTFQAINIGDTEALKGALPAEQLSGFRRIFWENWRGSGRSFITGGWGKSAEAGLVAELSNLRPVADGAGLALAPPVVTATVDNAPPDAGQLHSAAHSTTQVVSVGAKLFVSQNPGTAGSGFVWRATAPAVVRGMTIYQGQFCVGTGTGLYNFEPVSGTFSPFGSFVPAELLAEYQGMLIASSGATLKWFIPAIGNWSAGLTLESEITALEQLEGVLYIGTLTALYRLQGVLKPRAPATAPGVFDLLEYDISLIWRTTFSTSNHWLARNFCKMSAWRGALWFWAGGQFYRGQAGGNGRLALESQPIRGTPGGIAVCGGQLITLVRQGSETFLYSNDGNFGTNGAGWWRMVAPAGNWFFPFSNAGYAGGTLNVLLQTASATLFGRWLLDPVSPIGTRADNFGQPRSLVSGEVVLPIFMPEDLAQNNRLEAIQLLRLGVEWAVFEGGRWWPEINPANTADCLIQLGLSVDGGTSWQYLTEPTFGNNFYAPGVADFRGSRIEFPIPAELAASVYPAGRLHDGNPVADPALQLKIVWQGQTMPLLRRLWLDYKAVEVGPKTGLSWEIELALSDPVISLSGQPAPDTAQIQLGRLWEAWQAGRTLLYRDIDGTGYYVKLTALEQKRVATGALPGCAAGWQLGLRLTEIEREHF